MKHIYFICKRLQRKLNHHNGLTRCLQKAGKLLSTFEFRFRARDRQQKCDSVLPRKIISFENYMTFMIVCSYVPSVIARSLNGKLSYSLSPLLLFIASSLEFLKTSERESEMDVLKMNCCSSTGRYVCVTKSSHKIFMFSSSN